MEWQFVIALVAAIPVILFPAAFVWYLNIGGVYAALRTRGKRAARRRTARVVTPARKTAALVPAHR